MHLSSTRVTAQLAATWCAKGQQQKFAGWQKCSPAVVLSKIGLCMSARLSKNTFCENPEVDALHRASNGEYLPGPAESV